MSKQTEIQQWIVAYVAKLMGVEASQIDPKQSFDQIGLNSSAAVALIGDLEEHLDFDISPSLLFESENIEEVAQSISEELETA